MDYQLGPGPLQVDQNTIDEKIKGDIGIVENGDVATHAIPSGYYVIWKGDLYVAKTDISSGTTLSTSNLTAKPNGIGAEVAALNSNINSFQIVAFTPSSGITSDLFIRRYGRVVCINGYITSDSAFTNEQALGEIQDGHRPFAPMRLIVGVANAPYSVGDIAYIYIGNSGKILITPKSGNTYTVCYFSASYIVQS